MECYNPDVAKEKIMGILRELDIYDVVVEALGRGNKKGQLRKKENTYYALCPFHVEGTPSFMILPEVNGAGCLGCGTMVSPVGFIEKYYGDDYKEKILKIIRDKDESLFDLVSKGRAFESETGLWKFVEEVGNTDGLGIEVAMEESLHCRAYIMKNF